MTWTSNAPKALALKVVMVLVKWEGLVRGGWMNGGILKWIWVPWAFFPVSLFLGLHERTISL